MQDTRNLKKKLNEYKKLYDKELAAGNEEKAKFWKCELEWTQKRIETRKKNKDKNDKAFKKVHGHIA